MGRKLGFNLAVCVALASKPSAAEKRPITAEQQNVVLHDIVEGDSRLRAGDCEGAVAAYLDALGYLQTPTLFLSLARARVHCGKLLAGQMAATRALNLPPPPAGSSEVTRQAWVQAQAEATALAEALEARIPRLHIVLHGLPIGIAPRVVLDGNLVPSGAYGVPRPVDPGSHHVAVSAGDYHAETDVDTPEGKPTRVDLTLTPPQPSPLLWPAVITGGTGFVVGCVAGGISWAKTSSAKEHCRDNHCLSSTQSTLDTANRWAWTSDIGFGVAAASGVIVAYTLLTSHKAPEISVQHAVRLQPAITPGGISLRGEF